MTLDAFSESLAPSKVNGSRLGFWSSVQPVVRRYLTVRRRSLATVLMMMGCAGLLFRVLVARWSHGSNDINIWTHFCVLIETHHGVGWLYDNQADFNHPPLIALGATALHKASVAWSWRFDSLFKLPEIAADALAAVLVYRTWRAREGLAAPLAFVLFCWNPASFLVSAHHGNTDPTCAALSLLAAFLVDRKRAFWGGLALAAAINVKLIPIVLIPVLFAMLRSRRQVLHFLLALSLGAVPFAPYVFGHWKGFSQHVLSYRSFVGPWGVTSFLEFLGMHPNFADIARRLSKSWTRIAPPAILAAPVVLGVIAWRRKRPWSAIELGAIVYSLFLVLTPGFGVQYVVYPLPLLFAADVAWATAYGATAGLTIFIAYYATWTGTHPYFSNFYPGFPIAAKVFGHVPWLILLGATYKLLARRSSPGPAPGV